MNKIKSFFTNLLKSFKNGFKDFGITLSLIIILTIYSIVIFNMDNISGILDPNTVIPFSLLLIVGTFFSEVVFKNKYIKLICIGIAGIIAALFTYILEHRTDNIFSYSIDSGIKGDIYLFLAGYLIALLTYSCFKLYRRSELNFPKFVSRILTDFFMINIVYAILNLGFLFLSFIFTVLILDTVNVIDIFGRISIGIVGFFYIPTLIVSLPNKDNKKEIPKFIKIISLYVLLPLFIIAVGILYVYIIKILVTNNIPSNFVLPILSVTFAIGFIIWNLVYNYKDKSKFMGIVVKAIPYIFIPFILLQIRCVYIRFDAYGITPLRYLSYLYIALEIILVFLMAFKKSKYIGLTPIAIMLLSLLATVCPLNAFSTSRLNQSLRMKNIISKNSMFVNNELHLDDKDEEEINKLISSYDFLKDQYNADKYIPSYLSTQDKEKLDNYSNKNTNNNVQTINYKTNNFLYLKSDEIDIDISKYTNMSYVSISEYSKDDINENHYLRYLNINDYVKRLIQTYGLLDYYEQGYFNSQQDQIILINDYSLFYVESIDIRYDTNIDEITNISLTGFSFFKGQ